MQKPQPGEKNAEIVPSKDFMSSLPDCFTELGKFQDEPYHMQVHSSVMPKKTAYQFTNRLHSNNLHKCMLQAFSSQ